MIRHIIISEEGTDLIYMICQYDDHTAAIRKRCSAEHGEYVYLSEDYKNIFEAMQDIAIDIERIRQEEEGTVIE